MWRHRSARSRRPEWVAARVRAVGPKGARWVVVEIRRDGMAEVVPCHQPVQEASQDGWAVADSVPIGSHRGGLTLMPKKATVRNATSAFRLSHLGRPDL